MRARVLVNPPSDAEFVRTVRLLSRRSRGYLAFEAELRVHYPRARVRHRLLCGVDGERWYVYRDGRWAGAGLLSVATTEAEA